MSIRVRLTLDLVGEENPLVVTAENARPLSASTPNATPVMLRTMVTASA
jgi:hypothetical protein